jgi:ABC-type Fe3+-citrate transport system substrate-binding protein
MKNNSQYQDTLAQSDSVIELLIAQCVDLEALLALARRENAAAKADDFEEVFTVVTERASLSERLETYNRQISELRSQLKGVQDSNLVGVATQLIVDIQTQDADTKSLLISNRTKTAEALGRMDQGHRQSVAYLQHARANGLHCDRVG